MKLQAIRNKLILGLSVAIAPLCVTNSAQALTWNLTGTTPNGALSGSFDLTGEGTGGATITAGSVAVGGVTFDLSVGGSPTVTDVNPTGVSGIAWAPNPSYPGCGVGLCNFSLNFATPLTSAGGTFTVGASNYNLGGGVTGNVDPGATATAPGVVPFNFSTTPGLVVVGLITGVAKGKRHFPKIKKKIASWLKKK